MIFDNFDLRFDAHRRRRMRFFCRGSLALWNSNPSCSWRLRQTCPPGTLTHLAPRARSTVQRPKKQPENDYIVTRMSWHVVSYKYSIMTSHIIFLHPSPTSPYSCIRRTSLTLRWWPVWNPRTCTVPVVSLFPQHAQLTHILRFAVCFVFASEWFALDFKLSACEACLQLNAGS